jgi:hypothetical protein
VEDFEEAMEIVRSLPHGHVAAVLGTLIKTGLDQIVSPEKGLELSLILAMIIARIVATWLLQPIAPRLPSEKPAPLSGSQHSFLVDITYGYKGSWGSACSLFRG